MSNINWDDNAKRAACLFYDFIDEQGVSYASPDKMQRDFFDWLALPQQKTVADEGEKWTHVTSEGEECKIVVSKQDNFGCVVILKKDWGYSEYALRKLKPIKPKLRQDTIDALRGFYEWMLAGQKSGLTEDLIEEFISEHDII